MPGSHKSCSNFLCPLVNGKQASFVRLRRIPTVSTSCDCRSLAALGREWHKFSVPGFGAPRYLTPRLEADAPPPAGAIAIDATPPPLSSVWPPILAVAFAPFIGGPILAWIAAWVWAGRKRTVSVGGLRRRRESE
jgi:hypothetical protein